MQQLYILNKIKAYFCYAKYYIYGSVTIVLIVGLLSCLLIKNNNKYNIYSIKLLNASNITDHTPVMLYGYKVGKVKKIYISNYMPIIQLYINKKIKITSDSSISVKENGFLGQKILQLNLGIEDAVLQNRQFIYNTDSGISLVKIVDMLLAYFSNKLKNSK